MIVIGPLVDDAGRECLPQEPQGLCVSSISMSICLDQCHMSALRKSRVIAFSQIRLIRSAEALYCTRCAVAAKTHSPSTRHTISLCQMPQLAAMPWL